MISLLSTSLQFSVNSNALQVAGGIQSVTCDEPDEVF